MSQFYARYVPPSTSSVASVKAVDTNRKRPATGEKGPTKFKKRKTIQQNGEEVLAKYSSSKASQVRDENVGLGKKKGKRPRGSVTVDQAPNEAGAGQSIASIVEAGDNEKADHSLLSPAQTKTVAERIEPSKKVFNNGDQQLSRTELLSRASPDLNAKHAKVLSRFRSNAVEADDQPRAIAIEETPQALTYHDLEPIPQPKSSLPKVVARYATAPEWLRQPIQVDAKPAGSSFEDLGIEKAFLRNLEAQAITAALPVQSTVLPLLLNKDVDQRHDLCVAAATGSGKTLAYVLPILNNLRNRSKIRLRSVIVVPTRALVKQVVQTIDSCSTGIDIRVGTAEGSKTLDDERTQLVEDTQELDLHEWQRQQNASIDWSTFSLEETVKQATNKNLIAKIGYVTQFHSKIDILICTPGRLVEHLQTTPGFNLDDVDWFVADEADRLLNESYHEWLETVLPALKSQQATKQRDDLLRSMYMEVPSRRVTKILLSATMTKDISQLLLLDLTDPKLIVMASDSALAEEGLDRDMIALENQAEFRVPNQLHETAIAFKDSENKPLYLLYLLQEHILSPTSIEVTKKHKPRKSDIGRQTDADPTSSSGSSDSENESDSSMISSTSDSNSESDTTSVSLLSSTSSDSTTSPLDNEDTQTASAPSVHPRILIFTKSTESAHRLSRLLALLQPTLAPQIATFTRSSSSTKASSIHKTRSKILQSFSTGKTPLLICTDLAARGLDIPSLEHVINYDVPSSALTYIHRVGRTARAGREGKAWTLVEHKQGKWFWETIGGKARSGVEENGGEPKVIGRGEKTVQKLNVVIDQEKWMDRYEKALTKLGEDVRTG